MFISAISVPFVKKIAVHVNALDIPNERKVHQKPMPRLGGLAIFFAFLVYKGKQKMKIKKIFFYFFDNFDFFTLLMNYSLNINFLTINPK